MATAEVGPAGGAAAIDKLEQRIKDLEKDNSRKLFVQYLIYPLVLALIGVYFNRQIEDAKLNAQKLTIAQTLLPELFNPNHSRALASQKLITAVLPADLATQLNGIAEDYYVSQIKADVKSGNIESAASLLTAAQSVSGPVSANIIKAVQTDPQSAQVTRYQAAAATERAAFEALLAGNFDLAIQKFQESENAVNGYHQVYEIHRLLVKNKPDLNDSARRKEVFQKIVNDFYRGAPRDLLELLKNAS